jgi:hypothetical protein
MEANFKFILPEDQEDFNMFINTSRYYNVIHEFKQYLRRQLKYEELKEGESEVFEKVSDEFYQILNNNGITEHD